MEISIATMEERTEKLRKMTSRLIDEVLKIDRSRLNGHRVKRLPGNVSFCFEGIEGGRSS